MSDTQNETNHQVDSNDPGDCSKPIEQSMQHVVGQVGVFGALALLHDCFDRNSSRYETFPVIQREIRRFDKELREAVEAVDPEIDREVAEELAAERRYTHRITELAHRNEASNETV